MLLKTAPFFFGSRFVQFTSAKHQVEGLIHQTDTHLEILAIRSLEPGNGNVHRFIDECKQEFQTISVWEVWNPDFYKALRRWGFRPCKTIEDGKKVKGLRWSKP